MKNKNEFYFTCVKILRVLVFYNNELNFTNNVDEKYHIYEKIFRTQENYFKWKKNILPVVSRVTEVMATW